MPAPDATPTPSLWRAPAPVFIRLLFGLALFGFGEAMLVASELGVSPWTVFAEGVSVNTPMSVGAATVATSGVVLLLWIPLRQLPGLGTIANAVVIGVAIDIALLVLPEDPSVGVGIPLVVAGVAFVATGSGFYLTAALGPGPRDGLMTGLNRRAGVSLRAARAGIELTVLLIGFALGGTVGLGTVAFALAIGPGVQLAVRRLSTPRWERLVRFGRARAIGAEPARPSS
jgi:uncharacterized membrane protein YczE